MICEPGFNPFGRAAAWLLRQGQHLPGLVAVPRMLLGKLRRIRPQSSPTQQQVLTRQNRIRALVQLELENLLHHCQALTGALFEPTPDRLHMRWTQTMETRYPV